MNEPDCRRQHTLCFESMFFFKAPPSKVSACTM